MNQIETWRLFVAIPIPERVSENIRELQAELRRELPTLAVRWTKPQNIHLTLRFLGDVECDRIPELVRTLEAIGRDTETLELVSERIGFFPSDRFPRVVWVWVHDEQNRLLSLAERLRDELLPYADHEPEPKFTGHITIGRMKQVSRRDKKRLIELAHKMVEREFGKFVVDEIALIRSRLDDAGSVYSELARVRLQR